MLRIVSTLATLCALFTAAFSTADAATPAHPAASTPVVRVLVELKGAPVAADPFLRASDAATLHRFRYDPTLPASRQYSAALLRYQSREIAYLRGQGIRLNLQRNLNILFDGFAALVPQSQLARLQSLANVASVMPDVRVSPLLDKSTELVNAPQAWQMLGGPRAAGSECQGQKAGQTGLHGCYIADIDTGIDVTNPCFNPAGFARPALGIRSDSQQNLAFTNNKVVVARAFGPTQGQPYSAQDVQGHGTFTAAIEACDADTITPLGTKISGMAPGAYLMSYNVFPLTDPGDNGSQDQVAAALGAALSDGADVANLSLGYDVGARDPALDPDAQLVDLATRAGMVVVASAGNSGPTPQSVSSPSTATDAISVGASTNSHGIYPTVTISGPTAPPAALQRMSAGLGPVPFTQPVGPLPMEYAGLARRPKDDANAPTADDLAGKDFHGKIAIVDRGFITFDKKAQNVEALGARAVIFLDNTQELGFISPLIQVARIPVVVLSKSDGDALRSWLQAHPDATATIDPRKVVVPEQPNYLADFSARGPGPYYSIKPDLVAPGQDIYSATEKQTPGGDSYDPTGFVSEEGTSFSAPHVTGAVALVLQKHPTWSPSMVKADLMETAARHSLLEQSNPVPGVMQVGAGLLDAAAALTSTALVQPASVSFGQVNLAGASASPSSTLTLSDVGSGAGDWKASVEQLHGSAGLSVTVPAIVHLAGGGHTDFSLQVSAAVTTARGDYDGYVVLDNGSTQLHVPYYIRITNKATTPGTVLLVDDTASLFQPLPPLQPVPHVDVSKYFQDALTAIGRPYTYWNEEQYGTPSLTDMEKASAVVFFTGSNLNGYAHQNNDAANGAQGALTSVDITTLHSYLDAGGKLFITGLSVAQSDPAFTAIKLGGEVLDLSEFDSSTNDNKSLGGISPPRPSAVAETRAGVLANKWLFSGLKAIDLSTSGDGAGDNVAVQNLGVASIFGSSLVGVPGLKPLTGSDPFFGSVFGKAVLRPSISGGGDIGVVNGDDPSLTHVPKYRGRSVLFTFDFAGINDHTGYATRAQILGRVFQWLFDASTVRVSTTRYAAAKTVQLRAALGSARGLHAVQYRWEVGKTVLKASSRPTSYRFGRPGKYRLRVEVTDSVGHTAVSPWTTVTVR